MCNFVARTNRWNIESNYFVHTIIVFDLSYYRNVTITVTFVNQVMLCCAFVLFSPESYQHKSGAIFHIDLYVFYIHMEIANGTNELNHVKRSAVFQNKPFAIPHGRINHLCCHWNKRMLTIVKNTFYSRRAQWLPLVNEWFVIDNLVAVFIFFFWTWFDKQCCQAQLRPSNRGWWFFIWWSFLRKACCYQYLWNTAILEAAVVSKMQTPAITLWFPKKCLFGFFILEKQLASQNIFLVRFELSISAYLFACIL